MRIGRPTPGMVKPTTGGPHDTVQPDDGIEARGIEDGAGGETGAAGGIGGDPGHPAAGGRGVGNANGVDALTDATSTGVPADPFQKIDAAHDAAAADMERGISAKGGAGAVAADEVAHLAARPSVAQAPNLAKGLGDAAPPADTNDGWDFDPMDRVKMPGEEEDEPVVFSDQVVDEANLAVAAAERQIAGEARVAQKVGAAKSSGGAGGGGGSSGGGSSGGGGRR